MIKRLNRHTFDPRFGQWRDALQSLNDPTTAIDYTTLSAIFESLLHTLTAREERVLRVRYGLDGEEPLSREQVGALFQVTPARVEQIEMKAMRKLRKKERANQLEPFKSLCAEMAQNALPVLPGKQKRRRVRVSGWRLPSSVRIAYGKVYADPSTTWALQAMISDLGKCSVIEIEQRDKQGLRSTLSGLDIALTVLRFKSCLHPVILLGWQTDVAYMDDHRYQKIVAQYRNVRLLRLPVTDAAISSAVQHVRYWSYPRLP